MLTGCISIDKSNFAPETLEEASIHKDQTIIWPVEKKLLEKSYADMTNEEKGYFLLIKSKIEDGASIDKKSEENYKRLLEEEKQYKESLPSEKDLKNDTESNDFINDNNTQSEKTEFQLEAELNAKKYPAKAGAVLYNNNSNKGFIGMKYYFKGEIIGFDIIENDVGSPSIWLVRNENGYVMPIQHEHFKANKGDIVEVWGTLSGNGYANASGVNNVVRQTGSIHAMMVAINGEMQY